MEIKTKQEAEKIALSNKKVTIKPIERRRSFANNPQHDGKFMFTGCKERFTLAKDSDTGSFINTFEEGELTAFEILLSKRPGELSLYDRHNKFWSKTWVELDKNEIVLDLSNPIHALRLKILKSYKDKIAPSWDERNYKPSYKWAIVDESAVIEEGNKKAEVMEEAMTLYFDIKKSQKKMSDVLRLLDKKLPEAPSKEWLSKEISKIISSTEKVKGVTSIHDFIKAASDTRISEKIFVLDAIEAKAIIVSNGMFRDAETGSPLGKSMESVIDHFSDAQYQEDKLLIQEKIKRAK